LEQTSLEVLQASSLKRNWNGLWTRFSIGASNIIYHTSVLMSLERL